MYNVIFLKNGTSSSNWRLSSYYFIFVYRKIVSLMVNLGVLLISVGFFGNFFKLMKFLMDEGGSYYLLMYLLFLWRGT
jgi:hypothetical protein